MLVLSSVCFIVGVSYMVFAFSQGVTLISIISLIPAVSMILYILPVMLTSHPLPKTNLREKYDSKWALVSGGSSGIGKAIAIELANMGLNIVIIAKNNEQLTKTKSELCTMFTKRSFRFISVDLSDSSSDYMTTITQQTSDLDIYLIFNNAGYMQIEDFEITPLSSKLNLIEVNALSVVRITDHFYKQAVSKKHRALFCFTSSATSFIPSPFAPVYSATKAFLASFATSLAIEAKYKNIDVVCVNPGYVHTAIYDSIPNFMLLKVLSWIGQTPEEVGDIVVRTVGRPSIVSMDTGLFSIVSRLADKILSINAICYLITLIVRFLPDMHKKKVN
eukprot:TRINITY_DN4193_c0_g1_i1.p1 TRINITY_DN4193_c0_g1~~TRINITY_DN4193_c0_g1_i1.p1  ORF type:complete len:333 (-),score=51.52 TRINITY_DN4193_c0_g1_i1:57-1055(-)